jgi:hypothetical protein
MVSIDASGGKVMQYMNAMLLVGGLAASGAAAATCGCQCIDGVARTLCSTLDEARGNPSLCRDAAGPIVCPAPRTPNSAPALYDGPQGTTGCRGARLWDPNSGEYVVEAKVCELDAGEAAG